MLPAHTPFAKYDFPMLPRFASDRWLIAFFLIAGLLLLIGLDAQRHLAGFADALESRRAQQLRSEQLAQLRQALAQTEATYAEYLTERDTHTLDLHREARREFAARLTELHALYADAPQPQALLAGIDDLVSRQLSHSDSPASGAEAIAPPPRIAASPSDIAAYAQLSVLLGQLESTQQKELDADTHMTQLQMQAMVRRTTWAMGLGILLVLALGVLHARQARARTAAQARAADAHCALEKAHAELLRANQSYLLALDEIAYRHHVRQRRIEWSGAHRKVLGYDSHEMGDDVESWIARIHPEDVQQVRSEFDRALRERSLFEMDYRFRNRDGQWRWMHDRGVPHFDAAGIAVEIIGVLRDVTGMRAGQADGDPAVHRLRTMLDHMSDGFIVLDRDGRYLSVNERACELLRSRREDLIGRVVWTRFPDDADAALRSASALSVQDGQARHVEILHEPWQSWFDVDIYPTPEGLTYFFRDITQRKVIELSLRDGKARQELALWEVGVWEWDLRTDTLYLSPEWKSQLGYADHEIRNHWEEWEQRLHPDEHDEVVRRMRAWAQPTHVASRLELEFRMRHKDGSYRWMLSRGGAQADETGALSLRRGVHLDITDRKHAEQERSGARRRLQDIIASIRDGFVALDRNWNYTYVNTAAARLMGKSREEMMGRNLWDLFPESRQLPIYEACMRCMQAREPMQVDQYYAPHFRWYRNHIYPTDDGIAIFFEDFTARKRLEAQIVDERERYRATFEQPAVGILHLTLEGTVTRANQRMACLLGYQRADLVGLDFRMVLGEADVRAILDDVQHPSHGGATRLVECRFRRRDGEQFWGEMTLALVPGEGERPSYVVCMVQDISNRKRAETMLEESRQRLSAFAHQLTEAIEQERKRISREIHDELGQALTRLKMDLGWLRRRLGESAQAGGPVEERVLQMGRFIDETLTSVRRLATELRPALLDNLGLAAALNAQMRQMSTQADIEINQHLEPDLPLTSEQATGLYRIAQEALTNIIRHAHARHVRSTLFLDTDGVTMEIEDDGCGFDTAVQPTRGLGLVGIAERARLLGGRAQIESEPGRGTCVRVHLPILEGSDESPNGVSG